VRTCLERDRGLGGSDPWTAIRARLRELEAERRGDLPEHAVDDLEREYSPGRNLAVIDRGYRGPAAPGRRPGRPARVTGAAAAALAPYCRSLTCIDTNERLIAAAA